VIVVAMLVAAVLADWIAPYGYAQTSLRERFIAASAVHWLGTDELGRDLLTRLIYGARISLYVGFGAIAIGSVLATLIGMVSGYLGGRFDLLVQRGVDAWMAFPPRDLARGRAVARGLRLQHARRRAARPPRSSAERRLTL
jgi:peptide/nickel transport system permease protein